MQTFMNKLAVKFVKLEVICKFSKQDISLPNQKDDKDLAITKPNLRRSLNKGDISQGDVDKFHDTVHPNQKDDKDLTIGNITKSNLRRSLNEGDISQGDVDKFHDTVH